MNRTIPGAAITVLYFLLLQICLSVALNSVAITPNLDNKVVQSTQPLTITCTTNEVTPNPTIMAMYKQHKSPSSGEKLLHFSNALGHHNSLRTYSISVTLNSLQLISLDDNYIICKAYWGNIPVESKTGPLTVYYPPIDKPDIRGYGDVWSVGDLVNMTCSVSRVKPVSNVKFSLSCPGYESSEITQKDSVITGLPNDSGNITGHFTFRVKKTLNRKQCICQMTHSSTSTSTRSQGTQFFNVNFPYPPSWLNFSSETINGKIGAKQIECIADESNPQVNKQNFTWLPNCGSVTNKIEKFDSSTGRTSFKGDVSLTRNLHGKYCSCQLQYSRDVTLTDTAKFIVIFAPRGPPEVHGYDGLFRSNEALTINCTVENVNPVSEVIFSLVCQGVQSMNINMIKTVPMLTDETAGHVTAVFNVRATKQLHGKKCTCTADHPPSSYKESVETQPLNVTFRPTSIQLSPSDISGSHNSVKKLNCSSDSANPAPTVGQFIFANECGEEAGNRLYGVNSDGSSWVVTFVKLDKKNDNKNCFCSISYLPGPSLQSRLSPITIAFHPSTLTLTPSVVSAREGELITLMCKTDETSLQLSDLQFNWTEKCTGKSSDQVQRLEGGIKSERRKFIVGREFDRQKCSCRLQLPGTTLTVTTEYNISFAPHLSYPRDQQQTVYILEGYRERIDCEVWANPKPTITWKRDNLVITDHIQSTPIVNNKQISYIEKTFDKSDTGQYNCIAENRLSAQPAVIDYTVHVTHPPSVPILNSESFRGKENDTKNVTCSVSASKPPVESENLLLAGNCGQATTEDIFTPNNAGGATLTRTVKLRAEDHNTKCNCSLIFMKVHELSTTQTFFITYPSDKGPSLSSYVGQRKLGDNITMVCDVPSINPVSDAILSLTCPHYEANEIRSTRNEYLVSGGTSGNLSYTFRFEAKKSLNRKQCECKFVLNSFEQSTNGKGVFNISFPPMSLELKLRETTTAAGNTTMRCVADEANPRPNQQQFSFSDGCGTNPRTFADGRSAVVRTVALDHNYDERVCTCSLNYSPSTSLSSSVTLNVTYSPNIKLKSRIVEADEDSSVTLSCAVKSNPPATCWWFVNKRNVSIVKTLTKSYNHTLLLEDVKRNQSGSYICRCSNELGISAFEYDLDVLYKPKIVNSSETRITIEEGGNYTLFCFASGNPKPKFTWNKDSDVIDGDLKEVDGLIYSEFVIANVKTDHSISCMATTGQHRDMKKFIIQIKTNKIQIYTWPSPPKAGQNTTIVCNATLIEGTASNSFFTWSPNCPGDDVTFPINGIDPLTSISRVVVFEPGDDGKNCSCSFNNEKIPEMTMTLEFDVNFAPQITETSQKSIMVLEGSNFTLTCTAYANPKPTFYWYIRDLQTIKSPVVSRGGNVYNSQITLAANITKDIYCQAENNVGRKPYEKFHVFVLLPNNMSRVKLDFNPYDHKGRFVLTCFAYNVNPPHKASYFTWSPECGTGPMILKSGPLESDNNYNAHISRMVNFSREQYNEECTCFYNNSEGAAASGSVRLNIFFKPHIIKVQGPKTSVNVGSDISLSVEFTCNPKSSVVWHHLGKDEPLQDAVLSTISNIYYRSTLRINKINKNTSYVFMAYNFIPGTVSEKFTISVKSKTLPKTTTRVIPVVSSAAFEWYHIIIIIVCALVVFTTIILVVCLVRLQRLRKRQKTLWNKQLEVHDQEVVPDLYDDNDGVDIMPDIHLEPVMATQHLTLFQDTIALKDNSTNVAQSYENGAKEKHLSSNDIVVGFENGGINQTKYNELATRV